MNTYYEQRHPMVAPADPCERCEYDKFAFHTDPRHPERDAYICENCGAYFHVWEVGHFAMLDREAIEQMA